MSVYLDHNATSPLRPEVGRVMQEIAIRTPGNPSSAHGYGQKARSVVDCARDAVRALVGGPGGDLVFVGSGTEAVLLGMVGAAEGVSSQGRHLVLSRIEHPAGLDAAALLGARGWEITWVSPDPSGRVAASAVADVLTPDTVLVSVMHANNETGVIQPVADIATVCRDRNVLYHVDAVQSVGKIPVTAEFWGVDLLSVAAHKMGGPAGVGALWKRSGLAVHSQVPGTQEQGVRGGTHNVSAIAGFAEAARLAGEEMDRTGPGVDALRRYLEKALERRVSGATVTGADWPRLPNTTHITLDPSHGSDLVLALDLNGFAVSSGSACRAGSSDPSHVLLAQGLSPERAQTAIRISLGPENTREHVDAFVTALARRVSSASPRPAGSPT